MDMQNEFAGYFEQETDYLAWRKKTPAERERQARWQQALAARFTASFGEDVFISTQAHLYGIRRLELGDASFICAGALLRELELTAGRHCSFNTGCYIQGKVTLGDDVRIAPMASVVGMNHVFDDPERRLSDQGIRMKGIEVGDDVWLGAGSVVLDGVKIGSHAIVGAGAVVTKDVAPYEIVGGNPARPIRNRLEEGGEAHHSPLAARLRAFEEQVRQEWPAVLQACQQTENGETVYVDHPGKKPTIRAWCDAAEIAAMFDALPALLPKDALIARLQRMQKPAVDYDVLTVGYGLEVLGSRPLRPFAQADETAARLCDYLDGLDWRGNVWGCGADIDHFGTAVYFNNRYFDRTHCLETLFGWLNLHASPVTGMWGRDQQGDFELVVNGFYRLTRGTYAQFGVPLPYPEQAIDTLLHHSKDPRYFAADKGNACDVLDVAHPLWLCGRQTAYRKDEGLAWALRQIERILTRWQTGRGFSFELETGFAPGLQGTEMWLSILFLLCAYVGLDGELHYHPHGVHRLLPAAQGVSPAGWDR